MQVTAGKKLLVIPGVGFRIQDPRLTVLVWGLGFRLQGSGSNAYGSRLIFLQTENILGSQIWILDMLQGVRFRFRGLGFKF
jgi:hypothetical protein